MKYIARFLVQLAMWFAVLEISDHFWHIHGWPIVGICLMSYVVAIIHVEWWKEW